MAPPATWNAEEARLQIQGLTRSLADLVALETNRRLSEDRLNEAFTSQTFVLPLLGILGWETRNGPTLEVFPESHVGRKRADFRVRLGGVDRFYVEVKALDKDLDGGDPETGGFRGQAINYGWTKGLNWAVLTNFKRTILLRTWLATNDPDDVG